jgi:hypothetical protein
LHGGPQRTVAEDEVKEPRVGPERVLGGEHDVQGTLDGAQTGDVSNDEVLPRHR